MVDHFMNCSRTNERILNIFHPERQNKLDREHREKDIIVDADRKIILFNKKHPEMMFRGGPFSHMRLKKIRAKSLKEIKARKK